MKQKIIGMFALVSFFSLLFFQASFVFAQTLPADTSTTDTATPTVEEPAPEMPAGPSISSVSVTNITDTSARIDVNSDEMVQGYVEYGTSEQYGMSTPLTSEFSATPSFLLENLTPETLYHYRVVVIDSAGTAAITGDETFTTLTTPVEEPAPLAESETETNTSTTASSTNTGTETTTTETSTPSSPALLISNTETASVGTSTARITWQTNKNADGQVEYGMTNGYGALSAQSTVGLSHSITLSSLTPNTKYYYRAISKTASGEVAYGSAETFTTLLFQAPPSAPVISGVSLTVSTSSATITWTTSKPATSDIQYGTTTSYGVFLGKDSTLKTSHSRTLSNLKPGMLYHFRIVVTDSSGNTGIGKDRTLTTSLNATMPALEPAVSENSETLTKIAKEAQTATGAPQGVGGLPIVASRPLLLKVTPLDGQVVFDWSKDRGVKNGAIRTLVVRKQGTDSVRSRIGGEIIYDGPSTTFTDTDVENGKEYHYALYSYGNFGRFTTPAKFKVIPRAGKEQIDQSSEEDEEFIPFTLSRNLFQGRQGDDVKRLQTFLAKNGYYPEALVTGYFGSLTRKAVIRYQVLGGINPAVGYVGLVTRGLVAQ